MPTTDIQPHSPITRFRGFCRIVPRTHPGRSAFDISGDFRSIVDEGLPQKLFSDKCSIDLELI